LPSCQYNLRDLTGSICPECGEEIALRVNLAEPKQGLLIAGLVGLSAGAGLNGLLLIYMAIQWIARRGFGDEWTFLWINAVGVAVGGLALFAWIKSWRTLRRQPLSRRAIFAFACWALALIDIFAFSLLVR
jgi:hypothetical protein